MGSWAIEWVALPQAFLLAGGVAHHLKQIAVGLTADPRRMAANLRLTAGQIMAESMMMRLARHVGHETAHDWVLEDSRHAGAHGLPLADVLKTDRRITAYMAPADIDSALEPGTYLGECTAVLDAVLAAAFSV